MRKLGLSLKIADFIRQTPVVNEWFATVTDRLNTYSGTADPTTAEVPMNQWIVYKNTTSGEVRVWVNDGGVMKKSAAFT